VRYTRDMSPMFGGKKKSGKTIALVDVDSSSVGSALMHLSRHEAPKLFGETRVDVPLLTTRDAHLLARDIERAVHEALLHTSAVAARLRAHEAVASHGEVESAAVFFSPPWASMHLSGGTADFVEPMRRAAHLSVGATLGQIPTSFHPLGTAAAHGSVLIFPNEAPILLCIINQEVTELLIVSPKTLLGRATVPAGSHVLLRTLMTHGGMDREEARSYLRLPRRNDDQYSEPLIAAEDHLSSLIQDAARDLKSSSDFSGIIVIAQEPLPELLARALARHEGLAELFPEGGTVRAIRTQHVMPYIAAHARTPDLSLMLEALFINAKFAR
jgi:hypothetical protein